MDGTQILTLGLGLQAPWSLKNQNLDMSVSPHRLELFEEARQQMRDRITTTLTQQGIWQEPALPQKCYFYHFLPL